MYITNENHYLEVGATGTLFLCENWVCFSRKTSCKLHFSRWRKAHFVPIRPIQLRWRKTCISRKKIIFVRSSSFLHIVSLLIWSSFLN